MTPERSPEERERARLEREAKRAAREGRVPPVAPPPAEVPPRPEPPAPFPGGRPRRATAPAPAAGEGGGPGRAAALRSAAAQRILEHRRSRRPSVSAGPGRRLIPLAAAAILGLVLVWFLVSLLQPFAGEGEGSVSVTIPAGTGVGDIAELLEEKGVVSSSFFFRVRATVAGRSGDFKAGRFVLRKDMSFAAAMDALAESPDAQTLSITIPEGRARGEVQQIIEPELDGDYLALTKRSRLLDPRDYGARGATDLEGFLFPATYELKRGAGTRALVKQQLQAFKREFAAVDMTFAKAKNLSAYDVLVIASMVEREAQLPAERPVIASVIYNRLSEGIPLGIDATVRFATKNWTRPLKESELAVDSPYNTRERQGLPPGPIGSPGLASMKAAARPADTDFLYYVVKPGACGEHEFSETDEEFQRDVERYNSAREARGGKSPTDC